MDTSPDRDLNDVERWIEKASAYIMALTDMRRDGGFPDFVAAQLSRDIANVIETLHHESDQNLWTVEQRRLLFMIDNFRSAFKVD